MCTVSTGNVNANLKGRAVVALETGHRRYPVDFPGWGAPDAADYLLSIPAGLKGVITGVESHNSNPWTKYGVRFEDGTTAHGLIMGSGQYANDIALAN
jgi:hypothetical protein